MRYFLRRPLKAKEEGSFYVAQFISTLVTKRQCDIYGFITQSTFTTYKDMEMVHS